MPHHQNLQAPFNCLLVVAAAALDPTAAALVGVKVEQVAALAATAAEDTAMVLRVLTLVPARCVCVFWPPVTVSYCQA